MGFLDFIPGEKEGNIEVKLFNVTLLLTSFVFLFWSIYSFIYGYSFLISAIYISGFFIYTGLYIAFLAGRSFKTLASIYYLLMFILIGIAWLPSGGVDGAIVHMIVLVYVSGLLILPLRAFVVFIVTSIGLILCFSAYEFFNPGSAAAYESQTSKILDISIAVFIMVTILGISLYIFKSAYLKDRDRLKKVIDELEEEKEKVVAANRTKSRFLTSMSHEMRTPLNGVIGMAEMLKETGLNPKQEAMLGDLYYNGQLLNGLISNVLDFTLIEKERLSLNEEEIRVKKELSEITEIFRSLIKKEKPGLEISFNHDEAIPEISFGDLTRIRQILINLLSNAVKFTDKGSIKITSELIEEGNIYTIVQFSVADTGRGIREEDQRNLFNRFYSKGQKRSLEGAGLGLAISKKLVEIMGGTIGVESRLGEGSLFRFQVPFQRKNAADMSVNRHEKNALQQLNVLIADDVKVNQLIIERMLLNTGITEIDMVTDGKQALQKALKKDYDFIFMDIQMPEMNGIEASRNIMENSNGDHSPVIIAVTANMYDGDAKKYQEAGIQEIINKPFTVETLKSVLMKYHTK